MDVRLTNKISILLKAYLSQTQGKFVSTPAPASAHEAACARACGRTWCWSGAATRTSRCCAALACGQCPACA
eukprot:353502-Chlamydomonas_euryale.AAC.6